VHLQGGNRYLFPVLHEGVTGFYLAFQAAVYIWGLAGAAKLKESGSRRRAAAFCGFYLAAFAAYFFPTQFGLVSGPWAGILFSAVHIPALVLLAMDSRRRPLPPAPAPEGAVFEAFCERFGLSPREKDIARRLLEGQPNRQMEKELFLSLQTIKNSVSRVYRKFGVRNRLELMGLFRRRSGNS
jgi:DNA-binding CsgD family transcriptional regulator